MVAPQSTPPGHYLTIILFSLLPAILHAAPQKRNCERHPNPTPLNQITNADRSATDAGIIQIIPTSVLDPNSTIPFYTSGPTSPTITPTPSSNPNVHTDNGRGEIEGGDNSNSNSNSNNHDNDNRAPDTMPSGINRVALTTFTTVLPIPTNAAAASIVLVYPHTTYTVTNYQIPYESDPPGTKTPAILLKSVSAITLTLTKNTTITAVPQPDQPLTTKQPASLTSTRRSATTPNMDVMQTEYYLSVCSWPEHQADAICLGDNTMMCCRNDNEHCKSTLEDGGLSCQGIQSGDWATTWTRPTVYVSERGVDASSTSSASASVSATASATGVISNKTQADTGRIQGRAMLNSRSPPQKKWQHQRQEEADEDHKRWWRR